MKLKKYILPALALVSLASCNQEEVNTDRLGVTKEELLRDGLSYGAPLLVQGMTLPLQTSIPRVTISATLGIITTGTSTLSRTGTSVTGDE